MPKNQNKLPPHFPSQSFSRGRSVSKKRSIQGKRKVLARERLVNSGIRPSANSIKMKRVVRLETSVCFRITMLMNNQMKSRRRATSQKEERESDDKNDVAIVKSVSQLGCVSQDSDALVSQGKQPRGNPMQKVLGSIHRIRFTKSTLRHASIPEKKNHRLEKCQSSSSAKSLRYGI